MMLSSKQSKPPCGPHGGPGFRLCLRHPKKVRSHLLYFAAQHYLDEVRYFSWNLYAPTPHPGQHFAIAMPLDQEPIDPEKPRWLSYEELAAYLLNRMAHEF